MLRKFTNQSILCLFTLVVLMFTMGVNEAFGQQCSSSDGTQNTCVIGDLGDGNGMFNQPSGIAVNSKHIFVSDTENHRIQIFEHAGKFATSFGSKGSDNGQFESPQGITTNPTNIFVADTGNDRIQIFDNTGIYVESFGSKGKGDGKFDEPSGITTNPTNIFVADTKNNRIQIFDNTGAFVKSFGSRGSEDGEFKRPSGITTNPTNIFVADTGNNRIQIFDNTGNHVKSFGSSGSEDGEFKRPSGITTNSTHIFVADTGNHRIQISPHPHIYFEQVQITRYFGTTDTSTRFSIDSSFKDNPPMINETTGVFTWTPSEVQDGEHDFTIIHRERNGPVSEKTLSLIITEVKTKPILTVSPNAFEIKDEGIVRFGKNTVTVFDPDVILGRPQNGTSLVGGISQPSAGLRIGNNAILVNGILQDRDGTPIYHRAADILNDIPDVYAVTLSEAPNGLTFSAITNEFKWNSTTGELGEYGFTISARNTRTGAVTEPVEVTVNVVKPADRIAPNIIVERPNVPEIPARELFSTTIKATDRDTNIALLTYSVNPTFDDTPVDADSLGIEIDEKTGVITWTPNNTLVNNTYNLNPTVTDGDDLSDMGNLTLTIKINDNPAIGQIDVNDAYTVGVPILIDVTATDTDGAPTLAISSTITGDNSPILFNGAIFWTPNLTQIGSHDITITATDAASNDDTETITINVFTSNQPPVITVPEIASSYLSGNTIFLDFDATDERNSPITFSLETNVSVTINPLGFKPFFYPTAGEIYWTPTMKQVGNYTFTINATDGELHSIETFTINVTANSVPQIIPLQNNPIVPADTQSDITIKYENSDSRVTSAVLIQTDRYTSRGFISNAIVDHSSTNDVTISMTPPSKRIGSYPLALTLTFDDNPLKTARYTFILYVVPSDASGLSMASPLSLESPSYIRELFIAPTDS